MEIARHLCSPQYGLLSPPIVVSTREEHFLHWDTGYYLPWLRSPYSPDNRGCNLFIQYKLSELIEGYNAGQYSFWNCSYLRFQIPYYTKDRVTGGYRPDYNQFEGLKKLANQKYRVYYATNHVIHDSELFRIWSSQRLLDEVPFLDVSRINGHHHKVTFTPTSSHFVLHSDSEESPMIRWDKIYYILKNTEGTLLSDDVKFLEGFILKFEEEMGIFKQSSFRNEISGVRGIILQAVIISNYLRKYLNIEWYRYWNETKTESDGVTTI